MGKVLERSDSPMPSEDVVWSTSITAVERIPQHAGGIAKATAVHGQIAHWLFHRRDRTEIRRVEAAGGADTVGIPAAITRFTVSALAVFDHRRSVAVRTTDRF